jgi:hypothetical protein
MTSLPAGHARTTHVEALHQGDPTPAVAEVVAVLVPEGMNAGMIAAVTAGPVGAMIGVATTGPVVTRTAVPVAVLNDRAASAAARC